jgi:stage II sporulation protein D
MAVVARTYGLKAAQKFDGDYDHGDGTLSQVYSGLSAITPGARRAAEATRGEVLTYGGDLIEATYFSSSGGHTANNEDVWDASAALPYLRGRPDPYDAEAPNRRWTVALDRAAVLRVLGRRFGGEVVGFVVADRSRDGRVRTIGLLRPGRQREAVQANAFRLALSAVPGPALKSTWFTARRSGDRYVFEGRGFGHGVGLSQYGAHAMSERGMSYRDILAFYYQGATLTRLRPDRPLAAQLDASGDTQQARQETLTRPRRRIGW